MIKDIGHILMKLVGEVGSSNIKEIFSSSHFKIESLKDCFACSLVAGSET